MFEELLGKIGQELASRGVPYIVIGGTAVAFASLEDLVILKVVAGRPRDIEDARIVLAKNPGYDRDYILKRLGEFDAALGGGFRRAFEGLAG